MLKHLAGMFLHIKTKIYSLVKKPKQIAQFVARLKSYLENVFKSKNHIFVIPCSFLYSSRK